MLADRDRLHRRAAKPRFVSLARALGRLRSSLTVMNTGAHPDDEQNGMLAVMSLRDGMRVVIACSTRGEGGQNTLGPERLGALGLVRSRELEEAARVIGADVAWLGHGPEDPVHDFGFSKSGTDTLARWGRARILERLVRAYRQFRPDIVIPTFLDVPGQHGHHRAMTEAAEAAIALAADPAAFPQHAAEGLTAWRVSKYYLPAWSGGGDTYDDEVPPPPATTWVRSGGADPVMGTSYDRIGEMSRAFHASQNMGHWRAPAPRDWPLHLVGGAGEAAITEGLPQKLADLAPLADLATADAKIAAALAAFPDGEAIIAHLVEARQAIERALPQLTEAQQALHGHRLRQKIVEIDAALFLAAGVEVSAALSSDRLVPGESADLILEHEPGLARDLTAVLLPDAALLPAEGVSLTQPRQILPLRSSAKAALSNAFRPVWSPLGGNGPGALRLEAEIGGIRASMLLDPEEPLHFVPAHRVDLDPEALIVTRQMLDDGARLSVGCRAEAPVRLGDVPGLGVTRTAQGFDLALGPDLALGRHSLPLTVAEAPAWQASSFSYPHIGRGQFLKPVQLDLLALDLVLPGTKVGLVDGGADRVGLWLRRMGVDLTLLDAEALAGDLSHLDTIVIGIFAFGTRPDLARANARLKDWVRAGGHLVTLYHRPFDGWQSQETPPLPVTIGSPSLRWRVTNPAALVTLLDPEHPLLAGPNRITAADFDGWDKERGLYFASAWDAAYQPLLSMSDAGEAPLLGSLISAKLGAGRHTHTALVLHHQLDRLVPGAFRLMANLLQKA